MEYKATLRHLHITPRKVGRLIDSVRGKSASVARATLVALPQRSSRSLVKLIDAAAASARLEDGVNIEVLRIKKFTVDPGPKRRRFMPRAFGRVSPIEKRTSHVALVLEGGKEGGDAPMSTRATTRALAHRAVKSRSWSAEKSIPGSVERRLNIREAGKRIFRRKAI